MFCATILGGEVKLKFHGDGANLLCAVEELAHEGHVRELRCRLGSLEGVLRGLRYHFAGANILCSISKDIDCVSIDLQFGNEPSIRMTVSLPEYCEALRKLGAKI